MVKKFRIGTVQMKKDNSGPTVRVGNPEAKDPKYITNVEITVKDGNGNVLAKATNGYLQVLDPRKRQNKDGSDLSDEQLAKIPAYIKQELHLVVED